MYSLILCGGSGTRLWLLSRKNFPKQFLALYSDKSLLQETYLRMRDIMPAEHIFFVTNQANFFKVEMLYDYTSNWRFTLGTLLLDGNKTGKGFEVFDHKDQVYFKITYRWG